MRSLLAVLLQNWFSAVNLFSFFIFVRAGFEREISISAAIVAVAYSLSEGGFSIIAPKLMGQLSFRRIYFARSLIFISSFIFFLIISISGLCLAVWVDLDKSVWMFTYSLGVWSILIVPSWLGANFLTIREIIVFGFIRLVQLLVVFLYPELLWYFLSSIIGVGIILFYISKRIGFPLRIPAFAAINKVKVEATLVFSGKTLAFVLYSLVPLVIGWVVGSDKLVSYMKMERLKSMYSSIFSPLIQFVYVSLCGRRTTNIIEGRYFMILLILVLNFFVGAGIITGEMGYHVVKLSYYLAVESKFVLYGVAAACISVFSSLFIHFHLALNGMYSVILFGSILQMMAFFVMMLSLSFGMFSVDFVLVTAEFAYLLSLLLIAMALYNKSDLGPLK